MLCSKVSLSVRLCNGQRFLLEVEYILFLEMPRANRYLLRIRHVLPPYMGRLVIDIGREVGNACVIS